MERLRSGPATTTELARDVLRLSGPAAAVDAAVRALLGRDARFEVGPQGVWSLADGDRPAPLDELRYAVVDVETTGGSAGQGHRVAEIAVVDVHAGLVGEVWTTLVNPGRAIPIGIERLTGITSEMTVDAPWFEHVAPVIHERLAGRVFVAHNAGFDWRFVSTELVRAGLEPPAVRHLCTVRLTRRLVPRLKHRNLDAVARHFGIPVVPRHRAHGDALATARVLLRLLDEARFRGLTDLDTLDRFVRAARPRKRRRRGVAG